MGRSPRLASTAPANGIGGDLRSHGWLREVQLFGRVMETPQSATATNERSNSNSSMRLILFFDQSYYKISFP